MEEIKRKIKSFLYYGHLLDTNTSIQIQTPEGAQNASGKNLKNEAK